MARFDIDKALSVFDKYVKEFDKYQAESLSEADTRVKYIDRMLVDVLGWSESDIRRESHVSETGQYVDYIMSTNMPNLIVEAKRDSIEFDLPKVTSKRNFKIGGVIKNIKPLYAAMRQARDYAVSEGVGYCAVTNGHQWVFFRPSNHLGVKWDDQLAVVFRDLADIRNNFELFCRVIAKDYVLSGTMVVAIPISEDGQDEKSQFEMLSAGHLGRPRARTRNSLFPYFGEIVRKVFQDLGSEDSESEILEHCYVDTPRKSEKFPPFLDFKPIPLDVDKKSAGDFQRRVVSALKAGKINTQEVILLIGSVGVGKSTFIQRFRKVLAKDEIDAHGIWMYVNFKKFTDTGITLDQFVYDQLEECMDVEYSSLNLSDWNLLKQAYHSDYEKLKNGMMRPIYEKSPEEFEGAFSRWMVEKSNDKSAHCRHPQISATHY